MKKAVTTAVFSAVVMSMSNVAGAAANPFADVPAGHWAYDAVSELAAAGIIEGYGDASFGGDRAVTRYEMAQLVARAMTKDVDGNAKAALDKLAAEYAAELDNLGVRVERLEEKIGNVKFQGYFRMRYQESKLAGSDTNKTYPGRLRLDMTAQVNDDWKVKLRNESNFALDNGTDAGLAVRAAYAQGPLLGADAKFGKFPQFSADNGMMLDAYMTGTQFIWEKGRLTSTLTAGIFDKGVYGYHNRNLVNEVTVDGKKTDINKADLNYQAAEFIYDVNDRLDVLAAYHHFGTSGAFSEQYGYDDNSIWEVGLGYQLDANLKINGAYARSSIDSVMPDGGAHRDSYTIDLLYKGSKPQDTGSFGAYIAYRNLSDKVSIAPTYSGADRSNIKGWEVGTSYTIAPNITTAITYFDGKEIGSSDNRDYRKLMGELKFYF